MFIIENITDIFLPIWTLWVRCAVWLIQANPIRSVWLIFRVLSKKNCGKFNFFCGILNPTILAFRMYEENVQKKHIILKLTWGIWKPLGCWKHSDSDIYYKINSPGSLTTIKATHLKFKNPLTGEVLVLSLKEETYKHLKAGVVLYFLEPKKNLLRKLRKILETESQILQTF